jgi:predicted transcriptional regulator
MNYRSRDDIVSVILDAANSGGLTKTKIMYQAYLSHDQMKEYLSVLIENDLLGYDVYTRKFKTTEKGLRFLDAYTQMSDVMKTEQQGQQTMVNPKERIFEKHTIDGYDM